MIEPDKAKEIIRKLPPFVQSAGIFVDHSPAEIKAICRFCKLHIAQLHSKEYSPQQARSIKEAKVIKVFLPENDFSVEEVLEFSKESGVTTFLFDAYRPGMAGGTGQSIGKSLATRIFKEVGSSLYTILAGGLNHANVGEAIRQTEPYGVDTATGVERAPGIKDKEKMKTFIRAVREIT